MLKWRSLFITIIPQFTNARFSSANEALAVLRGQQALTTSPSQKTRPPKNSPISINEADEKLVITIPPVWLSNYRSRLVAFLSLVGNVLSYLIIWVIAEIGYPIWQNQLALFFLWAFCVIGPLMLLTFLFGACSHTKLEIDKEYFRIKQHLLGLCYQKNQGRTKEINQVKLRGNNPLTACLIRSKLSQYIFGLFLSQQEKLWLVASINSFLEKMR